MENRELFKSLKDVDWYVSHQTYGNNHSTLIGLLVSWWINCNKRTRWALEGGPSVKNGKSKAQCDAALCDGDKMLGILEVEGTRPAYTIKKFSRYFNSKNKNYKDIKFGIILLYTTEPKGRGNKKNFEIPIEVEEEGKKLEKVKIGEAAKNASEKHPNHGLIVLWLEKKYCPGTKGSIRDISKYYSGKVNKVIGRLYLSGKIVDKIEITLK